MSLCDEGSDYEFVLKTCRRATKIEQTYDSASNSEEYESDFSNERKKKLIFGVCGGSKTIPLKLAEYEVPLWIRRILCREIELSNGHFVLYKTVIYDKLNASSKSKFAPHLTGFLENFDDICSYNWCKYIVGMLRSQVMTSKSLKAGGCAMLIPFWLCEHTHLVKPVNSVGFPRFMKWDLNELRKKLSRVNVADLDHKYVNPMKLNAMKLEMEIIEALFRFWGEDHIEQPCTPLGNNQMPIPTGIDATPFSLNTTQSETDVRPGVGGSWYTNYTTLDDNSDVPSINYVLDFAVKYVMENEGNKISTNQQDKKNICLELEESKSVVAEKEIEIQRLKGLLTHEDEGFKARLMEKMEQYVESYLKAYRLSQGALHEKQLKQKDEEIKLLRAQNKELKTRLTELIVPTPTQVCENPENLARLDMLEQLHVAKK
ncbi:hypothetical protein ACS0TY_006804 [Phlomoides rotata]